MAAAFLPALAGAQNNQEIGRPTTLESGLDLPVDELLPRVSVAFQYNHLMHDDENATYGGIPLVMGTFDFAMSTRTRGYMRAGYGRVRGNPYYGEPTFQTSDDPNLLQVVPLQMGIQADLAHSSRMNFFIGLGLEMVWVREQAPQWNYLGASSQETRSGFIPGYEIFMGPDFQLGSGAHHLGFQAAFGLDKGEINHGYDGIEISGFRGRLYWSLTL